MWLCENNLVRYIEGLTENHYMLYLWTCVFNLILTFHTQLYSIRVELYAVVLLIYDNTCYFKWFLIRLTIISYPSISSYYLRAIQNYSVTLTWKENHWRIFIPLKFITPTWQYMNMRFFFRFCGDNFILVKSWWWSPHGWSVALIRRGKAARVPHSAHMGAS